MAGRPNLYNLRLTPWECKQLTQIKESPFYSEVKRRRAAILLLRMRGLTIAEICAAIGTSTNTCALVIKRCVEKGYRHAIEGLPSSRNKSLPEVSRAWLLELYCTAPETLMDDWSKGDPWDAQSFETYVLENALAAGHQDLLDRPQGSVWRLARLAAARNLEREAS